VPLLDLKAQYDSIRDEVRLALDRVIESQQFILGREVEALEEEIAAYSRCRFAIGVSSGTDALVVALKALGIKSGDEVITTSYSFFSTAGTIAAIGARPVFADIDPQTYNIDPRDIQSRITSRTRAVVPVHLFGQMARMVEIADIARRHGLFLIEDAAQAIGAEFRGLRAGSIGDFGCFSFYPTKNLGGFGDGGMLTTNDAELAGRAKTLRQLGARSKYHHDVVGGNFRLDEIQAAVLRVKLRHLDRWTEGRRRNAARYRELLGGVAGVQLPFEANECRHVYHQFVIRSRQRDVLRSHLERLGIGTEVYYPRPLHLQPCFSDLGYRSGDFPASEAAAAETLALPVYPELTAEMMQAVAAGIAEF
jgi:dTDP-4-amino-4,6-dideoxygalactose transaminase